MTGRVGAHKRALFSSTCYLRSALPLLKLVVQPMDKQEKQDAVQVGGHQSEGWIRSILRRQDGHRREDGQGHKKYVCRRRMRALAQRSVGAMAPRRKREEELQKRIPNTRAGTAKFLSACKSVVHSRVRGLPFRSLTCLPTFMFRPCVTPSVQESRGNDVMQQIRRAARIIAMYNRIWPPRDGSCRYFHLRRSSR